MKFNLLDSSKPQFQKKLFTTLESYLDYSSIDKTVATILKDIKKNGCLLYECLADLFTTRSIASH